MTKTIFWTLLALSMQSCYTAGYTTIGGNYFVNYSKDTSYYYSAMEKFGDENAELMLDSTTVFKLYKNHYFSLNEKEQVYKAQRKYPLYPLVGWAGLYTWSFRSADNIIYEVGLFNSRFPNPKHNNCTISIYSAYKIERDTLKQLISNDLKRKERRIKKRDLTQKFENEIIPLMQPYFEKKSKKQ